MTQRHLEFVVGLSILVAIVVLVWGVLWLGNYRMAGASSELIVTFEKVGGLGPGDPISVSGVAMGEVGAVTLLPGRVEVSLQLDKAAVIGDAPVVSVESMGLMGERFISITPGGDLAKRAPPGTMQGQYRAGLPEVMGEVGVLMGRVQGFVGTGDVPEQGSIRSTIEDLAEVTARIRSILDASGDDLGKTLTNAREASEGLKGVVKRTGEGVDTALDDVHGTAERIDKVVADLEKTTSILAEFAAELEAGEGTVGQLVKTDRLHAELLKTAEDVQDVIADFKKNPGRYLSHVKVTVF